VSCKAAKGEGTSCYVAHKQTPGDIMAGIIKMAYAASRILDRATLCAIFEGV